MNVRIINAPRPDVVDMIAGRMRADARARLKEERFDSIALVQTTIADLFYYADLAQKAAAVFTAELFGSCPNHVTTLAFFGETSAVRTAAQAIENDKKSFG